MALSWVGLVSSILFIFIMFYFYLIINVPDPETSKENLNEFSNLHETLDLVKKSRFPSHSSSNFKVQDCAMIHIAMVCAGYNATRPLATTVKSILFYRSRPIHFHFLVDEVALSILNVLFSTWDLPQIVISFYKTEDLVPQVSWIPNKHYSGVYGLLKLVIPKAISESKIIVLDTDLTFKNDIFNLWILFQNFNEKQMLGLVENQSNWYIKPSLPGVQPWPALGSGFNTGVMLMDLKKLRNSRFNKLWHQITSDTLKDYSETWLADQDIINVFIKNKPQILYRINCSWNVQLSDHAQSESCYIKGNKINIIHWNSLKKLDVKHKYAQDFRQMNQIFLELNGELLKHQLFGCYTSHKSIKDNIQNKCSKFRNGAAIKYRTHPFFLNYQYNIVSPIDVFLATQCSIDRLSLLEELSKHWPGVISIALYLTDAEVEYFLDYINGSSILKNRKNIAYHIVYKHGEFYPINYLRNVAVTYINIPYVFQIDIDFSPQIDLHKRLLNYIDEKNLTINSKVALVVPAFETQRYRFKFPATKLELVRLYNKGQLYPFRHNVWPKGHSPTNFSHYLHAVEPYKIAWEPDFEPYVVVTKEAPKYDTRFVGFGWNKVSHITHLTALNYSYIVLADTFIIHRPHTPSLDISKFRSDATYRRCLRFLKDTFVEELIQKYGELAIKNLNKIFTKESSLITY